MISFKTLSLKIEGSFLFFPLSILMQIFQFDNHEFVLGKVL